MKMAGVSTAKFKKAIDEGIIVPQHIGGRTTVLYIESHVLKIAMKTTFLKTRRPFRSSYLYLLPISCSMPELPKI
jgi:hypothetical protein